MPNVPAPLDLRKLKVLPLASRRSLAAIQEILVDPESKPPALPNNFLRDQVALCARHIQEARARGASVMLLYGAHLVKNGAQAIVDRLMAGGWVTHLATNGAGSIHDWEYAWFGASTESVEMNVASGTFGTWDETATNIHRAILAGAQQGLGYGRALGKGIHEDGLALLSA